MDRQTYGLLNCRKLSYYRTPPTPLTCTACANEDRQGISVSRTEGRKEIMAKNQGGSEALRAPSLRMDYKQKMPTYLEKGAQLTKGVQKDVETYLKLLNEGVTI